MPEKKKKLLKKMFHMGKMWGENNGRLFCGRDYEVLANAYHAVSNILV